MNGGLVPLCLLSTTIGLMLAFATRRIAIGSIVAFAAAALLGWSVPLGLPPTVIFTGLWVSAIAAAILVYLPVARWAAAGPFVSLVAGYWLGACAALADDPAALPIGLLPLLIALPARWLARRNLDIVLKIAASWMIAIASLSLFVSTIPTPGYAPDHME